MREVFLGRHRPSPGAFVLALVVQGVLGGVVSAHQKWLLPNFFVAEKSPIWLSFDVTWSDRPFLAESGVGKQPLEVVLPDGRREEPASVFVGKTKSVAEVELTEPGTYRLEAIDPLTYWTQVVEGGKERWLRRPKNEVQGQQIKRSDLYWSKAAAYVTVGEPADVPAADDSHPLDVLPARHPNRLAVGETLELKVVSYGKPAPGLEIKVFGPDSTGHEPTDMVQCDEKGGATYKLPAAGRLLLACQLERDAPEDPKADLHSFNVYLTLEVGAAP
jgi:uncharacterized GH25 family protein